MLEFVRFVVFLAMVGFFPMFMFWVGVQEGRREARLEAKNRKLIYDRNVLQFKKR